MQYDRYIKYCLFFVAMLCLGCLPTVDDLSPTVDDLFEESYQHCIVFKLLNSVRVYQGSVLRYQCSPTVSSNYFGQGQWKTVPFSGEQEQCPPDVVFQREQGFQAFVAYNSHLQIFGAAPTSSTIILNQGEQICEFPWSVGSFAFTVGCVDKQQQLTDWRVTLITMDKEGFDPICDLETLFRENMADKLPPCPDGRCPWREMRDEP